MPGVSAGPYVIPRARIGAGQLFANPSRSGVERFTLPSSGSQLIAGVLGDDLQAVDVEVVPVAPERLDAPLDVQVAVDVVAERLHAPRLV